MSSELKDLAKQIVDIANGDVKKKTRAYDTTATVTRVDGDTTYVHIPGGVQETPVKTTIGAKKGDIVQVRVANKSAWMVGNASAPPTDDTTANIANATANNAYNLAINVNELAKKAEEDATRAHTAADNAEISANEASKSARSANESAKSALIGLSEVEQVVSTVNWIAEHGRYFHTKDTEIVLNKVYYYVDMPTYRQTADTDIDPNKDYYIYDTDKYVWVRNPVVGEIGSYFELVSGSYYSVSDPMTDEIGRYYELRIDESVQNYIASHLSLRNGILTLQAEPGTRIDISTDTGITMYDESGKPIANYGRTSTIGDPKGFHIEITPGAPTEPGEIGFWSDKDNKVAYVSSDRLYIPKSVVLESMSLAEKWEWVHQDSDNMTLVWTGE